MVKQAQTLNLRRWSTRAPVRVGLSLVITLLFTVAVVQLWVNTTADYDISKAEQRGVEYLKPLGTLTGRLAAAQTSAVHGTAVDTAILRQSMIELDKIDSKHRTELKTKARWEDLRSRIEGLTSLRATPEVSYRSYTEVIDLTYSMIEYVAEQAHLVVDGDVDSSYVIDAAVYQLPTVVIQTGRAADLAIIAQRSTAGPETKYQLEVQLAVARNQASLGGESIASNMGKALDSTSSTSLGKNITNQLDVFLSALDTFVPPVDLLQYAERADADTLATNGAKVREAATALMQSMLTELGKLAETRADAQSLRRTQGLSINILCVILTGLLVWSLLTRAENQPRRSTRGKASDSSTAEEQDSAAQMTQEGYNTREARASEELVHVGRGIRARRRERADNAR
ncbi:MAG: hypothetical protein JXA67_01810 [Micromonosporaceae bacterium]|nr:hypothetical protein [Micromonosporaceae bacterium]